MVKRLNDSNTIMCCHKTYGLQFEHDMFNHFMGYTTHMNSLFNNLNEILNDQSPVLPFLNKGIPLDSAFLGSLLVPFYYVDNLYSLDPLFHLCAHNTKL